MTEPRRRMRREDRRDEILRRAIRVFGDLGYHNATTAELAKAAGVSEALLYQHFPSKHALLIACIERLGEAILEGLRTILREGEADPERTFVDLYAQLNGFFVERPELGRFSLVILAELEDPEVRAATRRLLERAVELLTRALANGQRAGVLRSDQDPEMIAWMLVGLFELFGLLQRLELVDRIRADALARLVAAFRPPRP